MPRPAITPEQRQQVRERIRQAARRLLQSNRPQDITVRALAAEAGIAVGTFYTYYENLTELGQSLWMEPVAELREKMQADAERIRDPLQRIRALLRNYIQFAEDKRSVFRGAFLYVRPESMKKPEASELDSETFFCCLRDAIVEGQASGQIREGEPRSMALTLWSGVHGALALPMQMDRFVFDSPRQMAEHMMDSLIAQLESRD